MKALKTVLGIIVVLSASLLIFYHIFFRLPLPEYSGTIVLAGLKSDVEVRYDSYGVPHIFAENDEDLFFAQGFITARERMFQMDMTRRAGRGELSVLFGEATINADKFLKTLGIYRTARVEYATLPQKYKDIFTAYGRGVNAYIETVDSLPREYVILGVKPEQWVPEDTISCGILMAYSLTRSKKTDLILHRIGEEAGEKFLKQIIPDFPDFGPLVSSEQARMSVTEMKKFYTRFTPSPTVKREDPSLSLIPEIAASNWMILAGSRTTTGKPIFTGSPDLEPKIPSLFYLIHLKSKNYDVIGGSLPGAPGVNVLGFNGKIAWSTVNGRVDELDYFIEKLNPDNPNQYLTERGYRDFEIVEETLKIKTKEGIKEEKLTIKISRHGPIISEVMPLAPPNTAMQWVGMKPTGVFRGFTDMMQARNFQEFRKAISHVRTPTLNMGYADIDGNIGYQYMASPPIRKKGTGVLPVPGWNGEYDWTGHVPFEKLPYDLNPKKGYFASFNNKPKRTPYHITNFFLFERALRFEEIAREMGKLNLEEARKLQLDSVSVLAKRWVPHILRTCKDDPELKEVCSLFEGWNFSLERESAAASLFRAFYQYLMKNTLQDEAGEKLWKEQLSQYIIIYIPDLILTKIIDDNNHPFFDNSKTADVKETRDDIIKQSLQDAKAELSERIGDDPEEWEWGKIHQMIFTHPMGKKLTFLNLSPIPMRGDGFTINVGRCDNKNPYEMKSGGVIRMIVDFSNIENSTFISPPGQSGQFKSPHYDDLAQIWADGKQIPMHFLSAKDLPDVLMLKKGTD
jgi:penicillin amidase